LFKALDLHFVTPELREGRGEIDLAESGELPDLVNVNDLKGVFHNHTKFSDGKNTLLEMSIAAAERGWEYVGIADHSKASFQANGMSEDQLAEQIQDIRMLNDSPEKGAHIFSGCEVDILKDGSLDFSKDLLQGLDYCVLSVHSSMSGMTEDEMTQRIIKAMETDTGCFKMLGHLTGRLLLRREGYPVNARKVIDAAADIGCLIELNANPWRLDMDWRHWTYAAEKGVLTSINPDAHNTNGFDFVEAGVLAARKGGLTASMVFNTRSLEDVKHFFNEHKN